MRTFLLIFIHVLLFIFNVYLVAESVLISAQWISDHGKIIKAVNAESADSSKKVSSVVIEELDVLNKNEPIRNLEIVRPQPVDGGKLIESKSFTSSTVVE